MRNSRKSMKLNLGRFSFQNFFIFLSTYELLNKSHIQSFKKITVQFLSYLSFPISKFKRLNATSLKSGARSFKDNRFEPPKKAFHKKCTCIHLLYHQNNSKDAEPGCAINS